LEALVREDLTSMSVTLDAMTVAASEMVTDVVDHGQDPVIARSDPALVTARSALALAIESAPGAVTVRGVSAPDLALVIVVAVSVKTAAGMK